MRAVHTKRDSGVDKAQEASDRKMSSADAENDAKVKAATRIQSLARGASSRVIAKKVKEDKRRRDAQRREKALKGKKGGYCCVSTSQVVADAHHR